MFGTAQLATQLVINWGALASWTNKYIFVTNGSGLNET